jgi:hypothetical protein
MHVELPKTKLHSFREFAGEYAMIVVSIITALGLEHAVQSWHHRHVAHEATVRIETELRQNLKELETVLAHNRAEQAKTAKVFHGFLDELRRGVPEKEAIAHLMEQKNFLALSIHSPTLRREAWDVAVASQAASWMEPELLERYAGIYAHMRDNQAIENGSANKFYDGAQMINVATDVQLGRASAQDIARVLNQMLNAYGSFDGNLELLRADMTKADKTMSTASAHR